MEFINLPIFATDFTKANFRKSIKNEGKMRKILITTAILLFVVANVFCLNNYGGKLGINFSSINGVNTPNSQYKPNFSIGFYSIFSLNNWLQLQPEMLLSAKGSNYHGSEKFLIDEDLDGEFNEDPLDFLDNDHDGYIDEDKPELPFDVDGHFQTYYLDLPVLLKANIPQISKQKISVLFGPSFNILLSGKYKLKHNDKTYTGDLSDLDAIDLTAVLGMEYSFKKFQLEFRVAQSVLENNYRSGCKNLVEEYPDLYDYEEEYLRYDKIYGYNTNFTLFLRKQF